DRHDALRREAAGHRHRVLFGDADVDQPPGELPEERLQAGAARHRRGDRDGALVVPEDLAHCVREDRGVLRRARLRRACRGDAVPLHVVVLGGPVAVAFLRVEMHGHGPAAGVAEPATTFGAWRMPWSFSTTMTRRRSCPTLFSPSNARPAVSAPSPMTATTWKSSPLRSRAMAMPCAAEMLVPA